MGKNMRLVLVFVALLLALSFAEPASKVAQQADDGSYSLVFSDEYNLPDGSGQILVQVWKSGVQDESQKT